MSDPEPGHASRPAVVTLPSGERLAVVFDAETIAARIGTLAESIVARLGRRFLVVALLKGSVVFAADLLRALHRAGAAPEVDFLTLSSYGAGTVSEGSVRIVHDLAGSPAGHTVLIVDDILESGRTLDRARQLVAERGASAVLACVLLEKTGKRIATPPADFLGFAAPDMFLVGYGMDLGHRFRELPFVGALSGRGDQPEA